MFIINFKPYHVAKVYEFLGFNDTDTTSSPNKTKKGNNKEQVENSPEIPEKEND